jgi:UDP-glucose 4-epimerase
VHVSDVVELLLRIMRHDKRHSAEVFNVCTGMGHSVPELFEVFRQVSAKTIEATYCDPAEYWDRYPSLFDGPFPLSRERVREEVYKSAIGVNAKARATFDWHPMLDLTDGIQSVYTDALHRFSLTTASAHRA